METKIKTQIVNVTRVAVNNVLKSQAMILISLKLRMKSKMDSREAMMVSKSIACGLSLSLVE